MLFDTLSAEFSVDLIDVLTEVMHFNGSVLEILWGFLNEAVFCITRLGDDEEQHADYIKAKNVTTP